MTRIAEIKTAIRHMLAGTAKVLGAAAVVPLLVLAPGCKKEVTGPAPAVFGGPADVTLILNNSSDRNSANPIKEPATKAVTIDEINTVHSLKIYAFKHDPSGTQNNELVAYGSYEGITGAGPHYIRMELSASGEIDFYVIANDIYAATTSTVLNEKSTRSDIENFRFTGLVSPDGTDAAVAVPMSNIPDGTATDRNNFTYTVKDNTVIPIEVSRAMARLSFSFAKSADDDKIYINSITIQNEPESAGYFTPDGTPEGHKQEETIVGRTEIKVVNTTGSVEGNMQDLADEDYLLPNNVGVSNSAGESEGNTDEAYEGYLVTVDYSVNGVGKKKEIYLPPVRPNDWVQIKAIFKEDTDNCVFEIISVPWERKVMDDIIFD